MRLIECRHAGDMENLLIDKYRFLLAIKKVRFKHESYA